MNLPNRFPFSCPLDFPFEKILAIMAVTSVFSVFSFAGDSKTRIVVLQVPAKTAGQVRGVLSDEGNADRLEIMENVLKIQGVKVLAEMKDANPLPNELFRMQEITGKVELGGNLTMNLELNLEICSDGNDPQMREYLGSSIRIPSQQKNSYRYCDSIENRVTLRPNHWQERASWGDAERSLMVWQYTTSDEKSVKKGPAATGDNNLRAEMCFFKARPSEINAVGRCRPETSETALDWLRDRSRLWKEASFLAMADHETGWIDVEKAVSRPHASETAVEETEEGLSAKGKISKRGDQLELSFDFIARLKKGKEAKLNLGATVTPGVWEFRPIEGFPDANVVAFRLSSERD